MNLFDCISSRRYPSERDIIEDNERKLFIQTCKRFNDNVFKILFLGDKKVGKTSILKQASFKTFSTVYRPTLGVDFIIKDIFIDDERVRFQLWDIAGQSKPGTMTRVYYKDAVGAFIVCDATRPETFKTVRRIHEDVNSKVCLPDGRSIPCMVLVNKCDEINSANLVQMNDFCKEHDLLGWQTVSAKENYGLDEALKIMAKELLPLKRQYPYETVKQIDRTIRLHNAGQRNLYCKCCRF